MGNGITRDAVSFRSAQVVPWPPAGEANALHGAETAHITSGPKEHSNAPSAPRAKAAESAERSQSSSFFSRILSRIAEFFGRGYQITAATFSQPSAALDAVTSSPLRAALQELSHRSYIGPSVHAERLLEHLAQVTPEQVASLSEDLKGLKDTQLLRLFNNLKSPRLMELFAGVKFQGREVLFNEQSVSYLTPEWKAKMDNIAAVRSSLLTALTDQLKNRGFSPLLPLDVPYESLALSTQTALESTIFSLSTKHSVLHSEGQAINSLCFNQGHPIKHILSEEITGASSPAQIRRETVDTISISSNGRSTSIGIAHTTVDLVRQHVTVKLPDAKATSFNDHHLSADASEKAVVDQLLPLLLDQVCGGNKLRFFLLSQFLNQQLMSSFISNLQPSVMDIDNFSPSNLTFTPGAPPPTLRFDGEQVLIATGSLKQKFDISLSEEGNIQIEISQLQRPLFAKNLRGEEIPFDDSHSAMSLHLHLTLKADQSTPEQKAEWNARFESLINDQGMDQESKNLAVKALCQETGITAEEYVSLSGAPVVNYSLVEPPKTVVIP